MGKPKKPKTEKPASQHEPTPDELDEAIKTDNVDGANLLKGLLKAPKS